MIGKLYLCFELAPVYLNLRSLPGGRSGLIEDAFTEKPRAPMNRCATPRSELECATALSSRQAVQRLENYVRWAIVIQRDYQRVVNPGYNADRHGPVQMVGGRNHFEF
jgi:hypothetical protein